MKRTPIVLVATVAGFAGVLSFHTKGTSVTLSTVGPSSGSGSASAAAGGAGTASHPSSTSVTSGSHHASSSSTGSSGASSSTSAKAGGTTTTTAAPPSSTAHATTTAPAARSGASRAPAAGVRSVTGAAENFGYGVLAVKVTVNGTKITSLKVTNLQVAEPTSQYICQQAIPMLHSEVLQAQSTRINAITGATYTSEAYAYSIQSALDKLHVK